MKEKFLKLKAVGYELLTAIIATAVFIGALIPMVIIFPTSVTADVGGELFIMLKGCVVGTVSLALTCLTLLIGFKTFTIYAIHSGDKDDPDKKLDSFREDFRSSETPAQRFRASLFSICFFAVWVFWLYALTPSAVVVQAPPM